MLLQSAAGPNAYEVIKEMGHQLCNMAMLYVLIGLLNKRARRSGNNAARQVWDWVEFWLPGLCQNWLSSNA